jgi:plasmid stability protein
MQNACVTTITIRNVPADAHAELVKRAAAKGQSLQEYAKQALVEKTQKPDIDTLLKRIEDRLAKNPNNLTTEQILEYLDRIRGR